MSLKYEPSSEPLHISAKQLFLNRELYRTVEPLVHELMLARCAGVGRFWTGRGLKFRVDRRPCSVAMKPYSVDRRPCSAAMKPNSFETRVQGLRI